MASPDGLRLFFGNRLPNDVLDNIFAYGFHLWLAKPVDIICDVECLGNDLHTDRAVLAEDLSERARKVVDFDRYFNKSQYWGLVVRVEYARPRVAFAADRDRDGAVFSWVVNGTGDGQPYVYLRDFAPPPWMRDHPDGRLTLVITDHGMVWERIRHAPLPHWNDDDLDDM
jgi:hypothetical protein